MIDPKQPPEPTVDIDIRIFIRVPKRFEDDFPNAIENIRSFTLYQFFDWEPSGLSSPIVVTIKPSETP